MKHWKLPLAAALALAGLSACDVSVREEPRTTVEAPQQTTPDSAAVTPPPADSTAGTATAPPPGEGAAGTTTAGASQQPTVPLDQTPGPAPTPSAAASAQATPGADPQTAAMGGPAATAMPADGVAAPTELQRFFEETPSTASSGSAAQDGQPAPGGTSSSAAPAGTNEKVSALPAVRNPGDPEGARLLAQRSLEVPVAGIEPASLSDQFDLSRGTRKHEAIDIVAPTGTPVVAVDDGRIAKLFTSKAGGLTIYQFDRDARLAYYYAHLHGYARHVREGMDVKRGELIGYVGATGNADVKTPHLHFAVFKLGNPPKWWQGDAVNPYPALARAQPSDQVAAR